jgi:hypothetical protein
MHQARSGVASRDLQALSSGDRHQPQADRNGQPHREAVPSWRGSSPLLRFVGLGRLCVDNRRPSTAVSLRPKPNKSLFPFHFRCPVVAPWSPAPGVSTGDYHLLLPYIWIFFVRPTAHAGRAAISAESGRLIFGCYRENWWRDRLLHVFGTQRPQCHWPHWSCHWVRHWPYLHPWATNSIGGPASRSALSIL